MNLALNEIELPVRLRFERAMTDDELLHFCAVNDALRVERDSNGEILVMTPAGSNTSRMNNRIGRLLDEWTEADGRGVSFDSSGGFTLGDGSMRNPDAAWALLERWQALSEEQRSVFAPLCPDFVLELRSPTDRLRATQQRMEQWIATGVSLAWLVDPLLKQVTIYRPGEEPEVHEDPSSVQGDGLMRGFELVMARVWS